MHMPVQDAPVSKFLRTLERSYQLLEEQAKQAGLRGHRFEVTENRMFHSHSDLSFGLYPEDHYLSDDDFIKNRIKPFLKSIETWLRTPVSLLKERGETHGDFTELSVTIQGLKLLMRRGSKWDGMSPDKREALEAIAIKIGRIVCGDPDHRDHWDDLIGYPTLARDRILQQARGPKHG